MLLYISRIIFMHRNTTGDYPRVRAAVRSSRWKWEECPRAGVPFQEPGDHRQACHRDLAQGEKATMNITAHDTLERKELCVRAALANVPSSDWGEHKGRLTYPCRFCYIPSHSWGYWLLYPVEGRVCCKHDVKPERAISLIVSFVYHIFKLVLQTPFCPQLWHSSICYIKLV